jgi:hypothetical protein
MSVCKNGLFKKSGKIGFTDSLLYLRTISSFFVAFFFLSLSLKLSVYTSKHDVVAVRCTFCVYNRCPTTAASPIADSGVWIWLRLWGRYGASTSTCQGGRLWFLAV